MPLGSSSLTPETTKVSSTDRFIWIFEVEVGASEVIRVADDNSNVTWNGDTYYAYPMTVPKLKDSQGTETQTLELTLFNVDNLVTDRLRDGELLGKIVTFRLVHSSSLGSSSTYLIQREATILSADVQRQFVKLTLGGVNWLNKVLGRRFLRLRCHHVYGGPSCGYDIDRTGALATCDRTFAGSNGCKVHGDDEETNGLARLHPLRFGGFPTIPKRNRG